MAAVTPDLAGSDGTGRADRTRSASAGPGEAGRHRSARVGRRNRWRLPVLIVVGIYFLFPLWAGINFAAHSYNGPFTLKYFTGLPGQSGFGSALMLSLKLAVIAWIVTMLLMVPTTVYIHLRAPGLRRLFDGLTILPIVIPPVVLITGVLQVAPGNAKTSVYTLGLEYAVLAMPFSYRALDAGLSALSVRTLFDASRSLGDNSLGTLRRVILPNMRAGLLSATVLTVAMVLGEFTMASIAGFNNFMYWVVSNDQNSAQTSVAASLFALFVTWLVLLAISFLDRRRQGRRAAGHTVLTAAPAPASLNGVSA